MKRFELEGPLRGEGRIVRQAGGMHRYGHVILTVEPAQTALSFTPEGNFRFRPKADLNPAELIFITSKVIHV